MFSPTESYGFAIANELWSNLVYRESSGVLLLISGLFNAVDEFHAGNNLG
jgi:hypothetical protein